MRRHLQRIYDAEGLGSVPGLKPLPIPLQLSLTWRLGEAGDKDWAVLLRSIGGAGQGHERGRVSGEPRGGDRPAGFDKGMAREGGDARAWFGDAAEVLRGGGGR